MAAPIYTNIAYNTDDALIIEEIFVDHPSTKDASQLGTSSDHTSQLTSVASDEKLITPSPTPPPSDFPDYALPQHHFTTEYAKQVVKANLQHIYCSRFSHYLAICPYKVMKMACPLGETCVLRRVCEVRNCLSTSCQNVHTKRPCPLDRPYQYCPLKFYVAGHRDAFLHCEDEKGFEMFHLLLTMAEAHGAGVWGTGTWP